MTDQRRVPIGAAIGIDALCVLVFAVIGRLNHEQGLSPLGIAQTAWPFLAGAALAWAVLNHTGHPDRYASIGYGVTVLVVTICVGHVLRVLAGGSTQFSFVMVSVGALAALLFGWRLIARFVR